MEAPDKIVLPAAAGEMQFLINDYVYIRKDTLLTFLKERRKGLSSGDSFVAGERKMLKEIIEKIESL